MTREQYFQFYTDRYHSSFQSERGTPTYEARYAHDKAVANQRFGAYSMYLVGCNRALDIGSSNNAFVDLMNYHQTPTWGVEIGSEGAKHPKTTYTKDLLELRFPPAYFDFITLHDVLEHFIDPVVYMKEIHRILTDKGIAVIDFPSFFEPAGSHHWKRIEHLWFFTDAQIRKFFEHNGFILERVTKPIASKMVYYIKKKPGSSKKRLLFMPGMGDIYWCLTKMESFIEKNNLGTPEAYIWDLDLKKIGTQQRSEGFLSRFPFMEYKGTLDKRIEWAFNEFYAHKDGIGAHYRTRKPGVDPKWFVQDYSGFDYVFNMNGILEMGESMVTGYGLEQYETNWQPTMFMPAGEDALAEEYKKKYGKFIFGYFTGTGDYDKIFNKNITPEYIYQIADKIHAATGAVLVLTGTTWDALSSDRIMKCDKKGIIFSEVNQTTTSQLFALMKASEGVFGWPAGNTIVAASMLHKPTVMVWAEQTWHRAFATQCIDPKALGITYLPLYVEDFASDYSQSVNQIFDAMMHVMDVDVQEVTETLARTRMAQTERVPVQLSFPNLRPPVDSDDKTLPRNFKQLRPQQ